jgi:cell division septal protein FtsQ
LDVLDEKDDLLDVPAFGEDVEKIFSVKREKRNRNDYIDSQPKLIRLAAVFCIALLIAAYFLMPGNKVYALSISGNRSLPKKYIEELSGITNDSYFYGTVPMLVEKKIMEEPLVESCKVRLQKGNVVRIEITEKKAIGYRYYDDAYLLFADGSESKLKSEYLGIIAEVPLIVGFDEDEQTRLLAKAFSTVDREMIQEIAEITQYALPYDSEIMKILMRNGGYFIANYYNADVINHYNAFYDKLSHKDWCIFAVDASQYADAYSHICPWDDTAEEREYWTDEKRRIIVNEYGDGIVKHYYTDLAGEPALDEHGKRIPIPIDENGHEITDADFQDHYEKGYYKTGVLVIPEEPEETPDPEASPQPETTPKPDDIG